MSQAISNILSESLDQFGKRINEAYRPILEAQKPFKQSIESINKMCDAISQSIRDLLTEQQHELYSKNTALLESVLTQYQESISSIMKDICIHIPDLSDAIFTTPCIKVPCSIPSISKDTIRKITDNISVEPDHVSISLGAAEEITKVTGVKPQFEDECSNDNSLLRVSFKSFFLTILYPLILMIIPMIQSQYQYDHDTLDINQYQIEAHKLKLEEQQLAANKAILNFLQTLLTDLDNLQESVDAIQESLRNPSEPDSPSSESQEGFQSESDSI